MFKRFDTCRTCGQAIECYPGLTPWRHVRPELDAMHAAAPRRRRRQLIPGQDPRLVKDA